MVKRLADQPTEHSLSSYIAEYPDLDHLHVRRRGAVLTLESGPKDDPFPHARFRRDTVYLWRLEMPVHGGKRWDKTPFRAPLEDLFTTVVEKFPWMLLSPYAK